MTRSCWVKIMRSEVKSCCKQDRPTGSYPARQWNKSHSASGLNYVPSSGQISTIHLDALTCSACRLQRPAPSACCVSPVSAASLRSQRTPHVHPHTSCCEIRALSCCSISQHRQRGIDNFQLQMGFELKMQQGAILACFSCQMFNSGFDSVKGLLCICIKLMSWYGAHKYVLHHSSLFLLERRHCFRYVPNVFFIKWLLGTAN